MFRAIILTLALFVAVGTIVPIATDFVEAGSKKQQKRKYRKKKRAKKYKRYKKKRRRYRSSRRYRKSRRYKKSRRYRRYRSSRRYKRKYRRSSKRRYRSKRRVKRYRKSSKRRYRSKRSVRRYKKSPKRRYRSKRSVRKKSSRRYTAKRRVTRKPRVRKYSKSWWRAYRKRKAQQAALAKRKRALRLRRIRYAQKRKKSPRRSYSRSARTRNTPKVKNTSVNLPESRDVAVSEIGPSVGKTSVSGRTKMIGGVTTTTLRRTIIDQMFQENGWVVNDYHKVMNGKKVYVVVAKSPDRNNRIQSRKFYFTESNGRIYRVSTRSLKENAEQVAKKSEQAIKNLATKKRQQASLK